MDTPLGNSFFYPFCPLGVAEEREENEGCCQWHDGNPLSDDFGQHLLQALDFGDFKMRYVPRYSWPEPSFRVCMCLYHDATPPAQPCCITGETEAGNWMAAIPGLGLHRDFWKPGFFPLTPSAAVNSPHHVWLLRSLLIQLLCILNRGGKQKPTLLWGSCS